jgi:hypothetical protein
MLKVRNSSLIRRDYFIEKLNVLESVRIRGSSGQRMCSALDYSIDCLMLVLGKVLYKMYNSVCCLLRSLVTNRQCSTPDLHMQGIQLNSGSSGSTYPPRRYRVLLPPCCRATRAFSRVLPQCSTGRNFVNVGAVQQKRNLYCDTNSF